MDGKGRNSPISGLRVSSIDLQTYHPKSGGWVIATMGRIGAFGGHELNCFDAFASPGG